MASEMETRQSSSRGSNSQGSRGAEVAREASGPAPLDSWWTQLHMTRALTGPSRHLAVSKTQKRREGYGAQARGPQGELPNCAAKLGTGFPFPVLPVTAPREEDGFHCPRE